MLIRKATAQDIPQLHKLFSDYLAFYKKEIDHNRSLNFISDRLMQSDSSIFVAESSEKLLQGFVQLYPSFSSLGQCKTWILNDLYVEPAKRKHGIGKMLILKATEFAQETGASSLSLQTAVDNYSAQKLYENLGWVKDQQYLTYYYSLA